MRYLWKSAGRWSAVSEKKRLMNSWESAGDCCLTGHCLLFWCSVCKKEVTAWNRFWQGGAGTAASQAAGADPRGAGIHPAALPDDFNVARGVCDSAGAGMADVCSLTVWDRNAYYFCDNRRFKVVSP